LIELFDTSSRLVADAGAIVTPTMILSAGRDWVVKKRPQHVFFDRLSSSVKEFREYREMSHAIFHELGREKVFTDVSQFLRDAFDRPSKGVSLVNADAAGYTRREYD